MVSHEFICKVLYTVLKEKGRRHYTEINKEFQKATEHLISDYYDFKEHEMKTFVGMKANMFHIDDKGMVSSKNDFNFDADNSQANSKKNGKSIANNQSKSRIEIEILD